MRRFLVPGLLLLAVASIFVSQVAFAEEEKIAVPEMKPKGIAADEPNPVVVMKTTMGDMKIELFKKEAPITTKNFLTYTDEGFFSGTVFHRVIPNFMVQGGGYDKELVKRKTHAAIKNEAFNGLSNEVGTIAMARTNDVNSATAQFFINVRHNKALDHKSDAPAEFGYAVFGKVIEGMDVAMEMSKVKTGAQGRFARDCPVTPIIIESVTRVVIEEPQAAEEPVAAEVIPSVEKIPAVEKAPPIEKIPAVEEPPDVEEPGE